MSETRINQGGGRPNKLTHAVVYAMLGVPLVAACSPDEATPVSSHNNPIRITKLTTCAPDVSTPVVKDPMTTLFNLQVASGRFQKDLDLKYTPPTDTNDIGTIEIASLPSTAKTILRAEFPQYGSPDKLQYKVGPEMVGNLSSPSEAMCADPVSGLVHLQPDTAVLYTKLANQGYPSRIE